jgi:hypothetical protein
MMLPMQRFALAATFLVASAALVVAVIALLRTNDEPRSYAALGAASIAQLHGLMTQDAARALLGTPQTIFRDTPNAQCWAYTTPYVVRMCFGPQRRLAWWSSDAPPRRTRPSVPS